MKNKLLNRGQSLIELLLAIGLTAILLPALATGLITSREGKSQEGQRLQATALLKETEEATRSVWEKNWNTFAVNGTYYPVVNGSAWSMSEGSESIQGFTREIVITDTEPIDPSAKKVVSTVSWSTPQKSSVNSIKYAYRYLRNAAWTQTSQSDFSSGTLTNTTVTNGNGGEIILSPGKTEGTYESPTFNATSSASFNYFTFTTNKPASTNINFQIATNNDNTTWNYLGPDGTETSYYENPGQISLTNTAGQYLRYKTYFTGSLLATPTLSDTSINYSP